MSDPQPERQREEARRWLSLAKDDLRTVRLCLAAQPPIRSAALLHAQQAVEKLIKTLLVFLAVPFRKTHDLHELAAKLESVRPDLAGMATPLAELTPWHLPGRYPGPPGFEDTPDLCGIKAILPSLDRFADTVERTIESSGSPPR